MYRYMFTVRGHPSTSWNQHGLKMSLQPTHFLHAQWASGLSNVWQAWLVPCVQLWRERKNCLEKSTICD